MKLNIRLIILLLFFAFGVIFFLERVTEVEVFGGNSFNKTNRQNLKQEKKVDYSGKALKVLKKNCGSCHQSTLPTAKPKALAIFDLDKKAWHKSVEPKYFKKIAKRIKSNKEISETDRKPVLDFIACVRKGSC